MIAIRLWAILALIGAASTASAQSAGPIHACVSAKKGDVRIVPSPSSCTTKESPLTWNADPMPQLIGLTTATYTGIEGALGFTEACQQQFPGTRLCTSAEVIRTSSIPAGLSGSAWVLFSAVGSSGGGTVFDASGVQGNGQMLTCNGWTDVGNVNNPTTGLTVEFGNRNGAFSTQVCSEARRVACCGGPRE